MPDKALTDKELRKLGRVDLLEILVEQGKENESLKAKLQEALTQLKQREIKIDQAGSIAEASLSLNGVFEAAQRSCTQYIQNIERLSAEQDRICALREEESKAKASQLLANAASECQQMKEDTQQQCRQILSAAEAKAKRYVERVSAQMNALLKERLASDSTSAEKSEKGM